MLKPTDLTPAEYNPRVMTKKSKEALAVSMETFNDISGITYNERTGNIVGGHHRWDKILEDYGGPKELKFRRIKGTDRYLICDTDNEFTGYLLRVVDWDEGMEKAANVTANSHAVEGEFTADLQDVLSDIREATDIPDELFEELRLDDLEVNLEEDEDEAKDKDEDDDEPKQKSETMISSAGDKYTTVKLEVSPELADRLYAQLARFHEKAGKSPDSVLDLIVTYVEGATDESVLKAFKARKTKKKTARRRKTRRKA